MYIYVYLYICVSVCVCDVTFKNDYSKHFLSLSQNKKHDIIFRKYVFKFTRIIHRIYTPHTHTQGFKNHGIRL